MWTFIHWLFDIFLSLVMSFSWHFTVYQLFSNHRQFCFMRSCSSNVGSFSLLVMVCFRCWKRIMMTWELIIFLMLRSMETGVWQCFSSVVCEICCEQHHFLWWKCDVGAHWSSGYNVGFWLQRLTVQIQTSVCCVLEQDTLSALLQSTQLWNEYQVGTTSWRVFSAMSFSEE